MADEVNENIFLVNAPAGSGKTTWIRQQVESYLCIIMELKVFKEAISCAVLAKYPWMSFIGILTLQ